MGLSPTVIPALAPLGRDDTAGLCRRGSFLRQRGRGLLDDRLEGGRLADGEIGQHLAVDRDAGLGEPVDEAAVGDAEGPHRGVEALDPQRAEGALAPLAVAEGVLVRLLDRLLGDADRVLAPAVIALGGLEDLLVLGVGGDAPFDASHGLTPGNAREMLNGCGRRSQALGSQYFLIRSPSVLNSTSTPRS